MSNNWHLYMASKGYEEYYQWIANEDGIGRFELIYTLERNDDVEDKLSREAGNPAKGTH